MKASISGILMLVSSVHFPEAEYISGLLPVCVFEVHCPMGNLFPWRVCSGKSLNSENLKMHRQEKGLHVAWGSYGAGAHQDLKCNRHECVGDQKPHHLWLAKSPSNCSCQLAYTITEDKTNLYISRLVDN